MTIDETQNEANAEAVLRELEDAILEADDAVLINAPGMRALGEDARNVVGRALRTARRPAPSSERRRLSARRGSTRRPISRQAVRNLLVASARARDIVGSHSIDSMTDSEIEAAIERLAENGLAPNEED